MSYKVIACHGVLQSLLNEVAQGPDPWESVCADQSWEVPSVCTFPNIDNAREVCKMWHDTIDASPGYATIRLARVDYVAMASPNWVVKEEYEAYAFNITWSSFNTSWKMEVPFSNARLRNQPLANLTIPELRHLRERLSGPGNTPISVEVDQKLLPHPDIWVA